MRLLLLALLGGQLAALAGPAGPSPALDPALASRFARLALDCVHKEYPNKIAHVLNGDEDVLPPRKLTPAFFGCFDWHSSVHGHWLLARLARLHPQAPFAAPARAALKKSLSPENIAGEVRYLQGKGRASFERPYGLAWLLQLAAELREWDDPDARIWSRNLAPLESLAAARISDWVPKLAYPIREGEHAQTAFAFGLILDWARTSKNAGMEKLIEQKTRGLHASDRSCPLSYEPSGQDFLSPCLAEADLMRRILPSVPYAAWLGAFLPSLPLTNDGAWLTPGIVTDPTDGKLVHLHGLNLSRAWMLEGMASGLPEGDPRVPVLLAAARVHRDAGIAGVSVESYEGGHWLGTFATYLTTSRGLGSNPPEEAPRPSARPEAPVPSPPSQRPR
ncbi:MAG: DUF2891 domain-containing protein [Acidobacteria bacterium]|nr:DUF2891 domain-containing protein [Acidobacteriota bacterium]MCK6683288.1 DUF2891 domain-containing protein [Thermoanaerobaculia bacterium]